MSTYNKCAKCGTILNTQQGIIDVNYPVFFKDTFLEYHLCRPCFVYADSLKANEFRKWVDKKEKVSE